MKSEKRYESKLSENISKKSSVVYDDEIVEPQG